MKYKVGDIVKIKKCKVGNEYGEWHFTQNQKSFIGKIAKILGVKEIDKFYDLDIDDKYYFWTDEMLEPVKEKKEKKNPYVSTGKSKGSKFNSNIDLDKFEKWDEERSKPWTLKKASPKPKSIEELECKHEWRHIKEVCSNIKVDMSLSGGLDYKIKDKFYCIHCLKIEYR